MVLKKTGFTLFEMLISVAIIALLASLVLVGLSGQVEDREIKLVSQDLASDIKDLETKFLAGGGFTGHDGKVIIPLSYHLVIKDHGYEVKAYEEGNVETSVKEVSRSKYNFSISPSPCDIEFNLVSGQINCFNNPGPTAAVITIRRGSSFEKKVNFNFMIGEVKY